MIATVEGDVCCSYQPRLTQSRLRPRRTNLLQKDCTQFRGGEEAELDCESLEFSTSSILSLQRTLSGTNCATAACQKQRRVCKCCLSASCQRTIIGSVSAVTCPSRSRSTVLRISSPRALPTTRPCVSSVLIHQLKLVSVLILLSVSLFHQVDLAAARAMGHATEPQDYNDTLPVRCSIPFSNYACGSIATERYTFLNGSCHSILEWIGGSNCEYDGTENSFSTEQECADVCIPVSQSTTAGMCSKN